MHKTIQYLGILLVIQLLILAIVLFGKGSADPEESGQFLDFDIATIDSVVIKDADAELTLSKDGGGWQLPDFANLPVQGDQVENVLRDLAALKVDWPVATTDSAAKRFEVQMENAQRSIKLKNDMEIVANLYLGTSPGYRKSHVRLSDSDDIYALEFAQHRVSSKHEDWLDKSILQYKGELKQVNVGEIQAMLNKETDEGVWSLSNASGEKPIDPEKIAKWVKRYNNLQISKLVGADKRSEIISLEPVLTANLSGADGSSTRIFYQQDEQYFVTTGGQELVFEMSSYEAKPIVEVTEEAFVVEAQAEEAAASSQGAMEGMDQQGMEALLKGAASGQ